MLYHFIQSSFCNSLDEVFHSEKIYQLNENMACSVAGITSDANVLTNELRLFGQRYHYRFREPMPMWRIINFLPFYPTFEFLQISAVIWIGIHCTHCNTSFLHIKSFCCDLSMKNQFENVDEKLLKASQEC